MGMATLSILFFVVPTYYFAHENYEIFFRLADLMNPELAYYIEREKWGLNLAFMACLMANIIFWGIFSKKMTAKIAAPIKLLRNHIRYLSRGDLSLPILRMREDDEFKELISSYNYLYSILKTQSERDLANLTKINESLTNPMAKELIQTMIYERQTRLNAPCAEPAASRDSLHAS